jgi:(E)-4-hydroxy-3-methylbut-2-enyl-diphosphate synthase
MSSMHLNLRLNTPTVIVRGIKIGGGNLIAIQSMTNTDTQDAVATAKQCMELTKAGAQLIRITVNTNFAAEAVPKIRKILDKQGFKNLPLIGDFHYNGHILLEEFPLMAKTLDKYRINPGNIGKGKTYDENFKKIIEIAVKNNKPVRIGVNAGSLGQNSGKETPIETVVKTAITSAQLAEKFGLKQNQIVLSVKMSNVPDTILAYELLAKKMNKNHRLYALHIGLTEAGSGLQGIISSSAALAVLINQGIGDTMRASLTPSKKYPRTAEVEVCKTLLQALNLNDYKPTIISCPGCGRTNAKFFEHLTKEINEKIERKLPVWLKKYPQITKLKIAIMGCTVNGPGEARDADIAISLMGKTERKIAPVYIKGKFVKTLSGNNIAEQFIKLAEKSFKAIM